MWGKVRFQAIQGAVCLNPDKIIYQICQTYKCTSRRRMQRESSNRQSTKFKVQSVPVYKLRTPVTHGVVLGYVTRVVRWLLTSHAIKLLVRCTGVAKYIPGVVHIIVHSLRSNVQGIFKSTTKETVYFNSVRHLRSMSVNKETLFLAYHFISTISRLAVLY